MRIYVSVILGYFGIFRHRQCLEIGNLLICLGLSGRQPLLVSLQLGIFEPPGEDDIPHNNGGKETKKQNYHIVKVKFLNLLSSGVNAAYVAYGP